MKINILARYVDQPILLNRLQKKIPALLIGAGVSYGAFDTYKSTKGKSKDFKQKTLLKNSIIIASAAGASLAGANGLKLFGKQIIPQLINQPKLSDIIQKQEAAISEFLSKTQLQDTNLLNILVNAKDKILKLKQVEILLNKLPESKEKRALLSVLLPKPENLTSKEIFSEVGRLSLLGAIPVVGGIGGGLIADKVTKTASSCSTANKIKEGFYQYFANIFLCNVGACIALFIAEGLQKCNVIKPLSPLKKMAAILTGITATGIVGGSWIANKLSQNFIDPLFNNGKRSINKGVYSERKPELADIALHVDDIATAGVLSGFKWIEPALPLMYFVSGYRAGIGYRNNNVQKK